MFKLLVIVAVLVAAGSHASAAGARPPQTLTIETTGVLMGPTSASGTFTSSGVVADAGTYTESFRLVGNTIHAVKTLVGAEGTLVIAITGVVYNPTPTTIAFRAGHWRIVSGAGEFAGLKGGGSPGAPGLADLVSGAVRFVHEGSVVLAPS